jgi:hypothetical protein
VLEAGKNGYFEAVAPASNIDANNVERADMHAITLRIK